MSVINCYYIKEDDMCFSEQVSVSDKDDSSLFELVSVSDTGGLNVK